jgi:integrase/recombinase XerD
MLSVNGFSLTAMYRTLWFSTDAGAYWSVVDEESYEAWNRRTGSFSMCGLDLGPAESTTRKYAESIALYYNFSSMRSASWADPDITAFQVWLWIAPSPRHPHASRRVSAGPGHAPARSDNHINLITYAVCEMFKFAAAEGMLDESKLRHLFEMVPMRRYGPSDRRPLPSSTVILRGVGLATERIWLFS